MKTLPIVLACDDKYIKYTSVTIASIISNIKDKSVKYKFHILTQGISRRNQELMNNFIAKHKNCSLDFIILDKIDISQFFVKDYYSATTYFRFFIPELFQNYDRVLYLDSDIVVEYDISELATMNFENTYVMAVQDTKHAEMIEKGGEFWYTLEYFYNTLKLTEPRKYFNAGVMLFNIKKMNEDHIADQLFKALRDIPQSALQNQDILNSVLYSKGEGVKLIFNKYNFMRNITLTPYFVSLKSIFFSRIKSFLKINKKEISPFYIYHFVEAAKPWKSQRSDRILFYKYLYSIHEVNPPKEFVKEIIEENNKKFPFWWKLFMKFFS